MISHVVRNPRSSCVHRAHDRLAGARRQGDSRSRIVFAVASSGNFAGNHMEGLARPHYHSGPRPYRRTVKQLRGVGTGATRVDGAHRTACSQLCDRGSELVDRRTKRARVR